MSLTKDAKKFFSTYVNNETITPGHRALYAHIASFAPKRVFEFGCGTGKNLAALRDLCGCEVFGIDISAPALAIAREKYKVPVEYGDESALRDLSGGYDVAFTVSVLDHIPEIGGIMGDLGRLAKATVVYETNEGTTAHPYWWVHDYEFFGLECVGGPYPPDTPRKRYFIWSTPRP